MNIMTGDSALSQLYLRHLIFVRTLGIFPHVTACLAPCDTRSDTGLVLIDFAQSTLVY